MQNRDDIIEYLDEDTIGYCDGCETDTQEELYTEDGYTYYCRYCWNEIQSKHKEEK